MLSVDDRVEEICKKVSNVEDGEGMAGRRHGPNMREKMRTEQFSSTFSIPTEVKIYPNKIDLHAFLKRGRACLLRQKGRVGRRSQATWLRRHWKESSDEAENDYKIASAKTGKAKDAYREFYSWESKLKDWIDNAEKADEKAQTVVGPNKSFRSCRQALGEEFRPGPWRASRYSYAS